MKTKYILNDLKSMLHCASLVLSNSTTMAFNCIFVILCLTSLCNAKGLFDDEQEIAVQNVFRHILKLQPPNGDIVNKIAKPPKHMLELYQKYSNAGGFKQTSGNTVRSILPTTKGSSPATQMLVFNVTCVDQSEEVNLAQLHLHRRRLPRVNASNRHRRILAPPYRVRIFQVINHRTRAIPLASLPVAQHTRGGWHSLDITAVLRELLLSTSSSNLQLGVRFEAPKNKPISHDHFLKTSNETSAFLVVFSDDNGLLTDETRALNPVRHTHALAAMLQQNSGRAFESFSLKNAPKALNEDRPLNRTNDDLYLDTADKEYTSDTSNKKSTSEEHNSFESFMKEKKKGGTMKSQLDSAKRTPVYTLRLEESDNMIIDEDNDEEKSGRWSTRNGVEELSKKTVKKMSAHRYRRIHPKTRYRVRPRNHIDTSSEDIEKRITRSAPEDDDMTSHASRLITAGVSRLWAVGGRVIRSIVDNELPDTLPRGGEIPKTSPETLLKTRDSQDSRRRSSNVIPLPARSSKRWRGGGGGGGGGGGRKRGRGKKREGRKKGKKVVENWHQSVEQSSEEWHENFARMDRDGTSTCHKNKLVVDFADIGWSDWIISPQKFEAHYCIGQCIYPLTKAKENRLGTECAAALKPTNHATIQSLVHAIGQHTEVPDPCCVPDKLSPMSLLYLDDNNNVVLRSYHDMTVDTCACR